MTPPSVIGGIAVAITVFALVGGRLAHQWWRSVSGGVVKLDAGLKPLQHGQQHLLNFRLFKKIEATDWCVNVAIVDRSDSSGFQTVWSEKFPAQSLVNGLVQCTITLPADMPSSFDAQGQARSWFEVNLTLQASHYSWFFKLATVPAD
jgi:hypothetical protein